MFDEGVIAVAEPQRLGPILRCLRARLGQDVDDALIAVEVEAALVLYATARVTQFVPILVERRVRERLCPRDVRWRT
jgi:hypothetical protein